MIEDLERLRHACLDLAVQIISPREVAEEWIRYAAVLGIAIAWLREAQNANQP